MYLRAMEMLVEKRGKSFVPVFADTGNEHPATLEYVKNFHSLTGGPQVQFVKADFTKRIARKREYILKHWEKDEVPEDKVRQALEVLHPTGVPFLDLCLWKGKFPSRVSQFCTEELKGAPIADQIKKPIIQGGGVVLSWQGIRAEESPKRAAAPRFEMVSRTHWIFRPVLRWGVPEVFAIARKHGLPPNPLYKNGMGRVGCMPCVNATKSEIRQIGLRYPEHFERIAQWEELVSWASKWGCSTFFAVPVKKGRFKGIDPATIHYKTHGIAEQFEWSKTARGGRQFDLNVANDEYEASVNFCKSLYGLCE